MADKAESGTGRIKKSKDRPPVKIIVTPVYIGNREMKEVFETVALNNLKNRSDRD